jgi:hypothetical protein
MEFAPPALALMSCTIHALGVAAGSMSIGSDVQAAPREPAYLGSRACRACHRAIYESYSRTAMGQTSGPALPSLIEGTYRHERSGVEYRVYADGGKAYLAYERPGHPGMRGRQELEDFVGSNTTPGSCLSERRAMNPGISVWPTRRSLCGETHTLRKRPSAFCSSRSPPIRGH